MRRFSYEIVGWLGCFIFKSTILILDKKKKKEKYTHIYVLWIEWLININYKKEKRKERTEDDVAAQEVKTWIAVICNDERLHVKCITTQLSVFGVGTASELATTHLHVTHLCNAAGYSTWHYPTTIPIPCIWCIP